MKNYNVTVNGVTYEVTVEELGEVSAPATTVAAPAAPVAPKAAPAAPKAAPAAAPAAGGETVKAPMPGTILKMNVKVGDKVEKDGLVCVLEAMKMETNVLASMKGTVDRIYIHEGQQVKAGELIIKLK